MALLEHPRQTYDFSSIVDPQPTTLSSTPSLISTSPSANSLTISIAKEKPPQRTSSSSSLSSLLKIGGSTPPVMHTTASANHNQSHNNNNNNHVDYLTHSVSANFSPSSSPSSVSEFNDYRQARASRGSRMISPPAVSVRCLVYLPPNVPVKKVELEAQKDWSTARFIDEILRYSAEVHHILEDNDASEFFLRIAEDDGSIDDDCPILDQTRLVCQTGAKIFVLQAKPNSRAPRRSFSANILPHRGSIPTDSRAPSPERSPRKESLFCCFC